MAKEKIVKHPTTEELISLDSKYSSMRWAFLFMVKLGAWLSVGSLISMLICALLDKSFPEAGAAALVGVILTTAFGGKALQAGRELPTDTPEEQKGDDPNSPPK